MIIMQKESYTCIKCHTHLHASREKTGAMISTNLQLEEAKFVSLCMFKRVRRDTQFKKGRRMHTLHREVDGDQGTNQASPLFL